MIVTLLLALLSCKPGLQLDEFAERYTDAYCEACMECGDCDTVSTMAECRAYVESSILPDVAPDDCDLVQDVAEDCLQAMESQTCLNNDGVGLCASACD